MCIFSFGRYCQAVFHSGGSHSGLTVRFLSGNTCCDESEFAVLWGKGQARWQEEICGNNPLQSLWFKLQKMMRVKGMEMRSFKGKHPDLIIN